LTCDERRALPTKTKAWLNVTASAKPQRCVRGSVAGTRPDRKKTNAAKGKAHTATKASAVARKGELVPDSGHETFYARSGQR